MVDVIHSIQTHINVKQNNYCRWVNKQVGRGWVNRWVGGLVGKGVNTKVWLKAKGLVKK